MNYQRESNKLKNKYCKKCQNDYECFDCTIFNKKIELLRQITWEKKCSGK